MAAGRGTRAELPRSPGSSRQGSFGALVARIGAGSPPADADESPEAEVVRIARDHVAHPEIAAEFDAKYRVILRPDSIFPTVRRDPGREDLARRYRDVWEYRLIESHFRPVAGLFRQTVESVCAIHDDASLPLLLRLLHQCADVYHRGDLDQCQVVPFYLSGLTRFVSPRGFDALVAAVAACDAAETGLHVDPSWRIDAAKRIRASVRHIRRGDLDGRWEETLIAYRRDPANRSDARALDRILGEERMEP